MTEYSMLWETKNSLGDGANSYELDQGYDFFKDFDNQGVDTGVAAEVGNALRPSPNIVTKDVTIGSGKAMVGGLRYDNDTAVVFPQSAPASDTGHRIVLRADWATQTIRLTQISSTVGTTTYPALTQVYGTTYDIPICGFITEAGGNVTDSAGNNNAINDERDYIRTPGSAGVVSRIYDEAQLPQRLYLPQAYRHCVITLGGRSNYNINPAVNGYYFHYLNRLTTAGNYIQSAITKEGSGDASGGFPGNSTLRFSSVEIGRELYPYAVFYRLFMPNYSLSNHHKIGLHEQAFNTGSGWSFRSTMASTILSTDPITEMTFDEVRGDLDQMRLSVACWR